MMSNYQSTLSKLAALYGLTAIFAFGSRGQEAIACLQGRSPSSPGSDSDLDMAVQPVPGKSLSTGDKVDQRYKKER